MKDKPRDITQQDRDNLPVGAEGRLPPFDFFLQGRGRKLFSSGFHFTMVI